MSSTGRSTPVQKATPEETFSSLCTTFELCYLIKDCLLETGLKDLEDLRFFFTTESDVRTWINKTSQADFQLMDPPTT